MVLEFIIFALVILAIVQSIRIIGFISGGGLFVPFVCFAAGTLLVGLSRLFLFLAEAGYYTLADVDIHLWWHGIFYLSMLCFIWGGKRLKDLSRPGSGKAFGVVDALVVAGSTVLGIGAFFVATPLEQALSSLFVGTWFDTYGIHHLGAVLLAAICAWYVRYINTSWGKLLSVSVVPLLVFLILMSMQHLWELLVESLGVIVLPGETIETVEQFIVIPALLSLVFGLSRIVGFMRRNR